MGQITPRLTTDRARQSDTGARETGERMQRDEQKGEKFHVTQAAVVIQDKGRQREPFH